MDLGPKIDKRLKEYWAADSEMQIKEFNFFQKNFWV
jgi:hypothetical protein